MRMLRMTYLAREEPTRPATVEFTLDEVHAVYLARSSSWNGKQVPTVGKMVGWIAEMGGYTKSKSGGPAGITIVARGWDRIAPIVAVVARLRAVQPSGPGG